MDAPASGEAAPTRYRDRMERWVLLSGDRLLLTGALVVAFYLLLVVCAAVDVVGFQDDAAMTRMAGGMIAGTFSLITIVLTINQLILSQELGHAGKMEDQLDATLDLRARVEDEAGVPTSPNAPVDFLLLVVRTMRERALELRELVGETEDQADIADEAGRYADAMVDEAEMLDDLLSTVDVQSLNEITDILEYQEAFDFTYGHELRARVDGQLSEDVSDALTALVRTQRLFLIAQSYTRTMYLQLELARLSRLVLYVGLPAVASAFVFGLQYADIAPVVAPAYRFLIVPGLLALVFSPLALLAAYMIRIATITQRTAGGGTFIP